VLALGNFELSKNASLPTLPRLHGKIGELDPFHRYGVIDLLLMPDQ